MCSRPGKGSRSTYGAYGIPAIHLVRYAEITVSDSRGQKTEELGETPSCFSLQALFAPGVMYFISLVRFPIIENPLMSVRCPGIVLGSGRPELRSADYARQIGSYLPKPFPDCPGLEIRLQDIDQ